MKNVKTLLIDLDGTLVDMKGFLVSLDFTFHCLGFLKKKIGLRRSLKLFLRVHREMTKRHSALAVVNLTNDKKAIAALAKGAQISEVEAGILLREILTQVFPKLKRHFKPVLGASEFIQWARSRYQLILATNPVWPVDIILQRVSWANINPSDFTFVSHAENMHFIKPDPRYYQEILDINHLQSNECLHIGNEIEMDFPATEVGIPVFIISRRGGLRKLVRKSQKSPGFKGGFNSLKKLLSSDRTFS